MIDKPLGEFVPRRYAAFVLFSFLITFANAISHGSYHIVSLAILGCTIGLFSFGVKSEIVSAPTGAVRTVAFGWAVIVALVTFQIIALVDPKLTSTPARSLVPLRITQGLNLALVLSYVPALSGRVVESPRIKNGRFALLAMVAAAGGLSMLYASPRPEIDVWDIQMRGAEALMQGINPYTSVTVPDTDPESVMTIPYVYPPPALYVGVLGLVLGKDVRVALLIAILVAGFALRAIAKRSFDGPALIVDAPALLFWFSPIIFFILDKAWIDPVQVMLISVGSALFANKRRLSGAMVIGAAVASKQSMFWLIPFVGFGMRLKPREWAAMFGATAALLLPFVVWDFARLKYCNFDFMSGLPPRSDALAFAPFIQRTFHAAFPGAAGFVLAGAVACTFVAKGQRTLGATTRAVAFTYLLFFFFNRWAFANYYFLIAGLCAIAAAASLSTPDEQLQSA